MADFEIGPMMKKKLNSNLREVRKQTEVLIEKAQVEMKRTKGVANIKDKEYVKRFNKITKKFQDEMENLLSAKEYEALFALNRDERIVLADPDILKSEYGIDIKY